MAVTAKLPSTLSLEKDPKLALELGIVEAYQSNVPIAAIESRYSVWDDEIYKILKRHNIQPQRRSISAEVELQIIAAYQDGYRVRDICEEFAVAPGTVYAALDRCNIARRHRRYRFKVGAFVPINGVYSPEQKYWGGSLLVRGSVHIVKGFSPTLAVQGSLERLECFKQFLGSNHKIHPSGNEFIVRVLNPSWVKDLAPFGLTPRIRTHRLPAESFARDKHYWRGIIDEAGTLQFADDSSGCSITFYAKPKACHAFHRLTKRIYSGAFVSYRYTVDERMARFQVSGLGAAATAQWLYAGDCYTAKPENKKIALAMARIIPADFY